LIADKLEALLEEKELVVRKGKVKRVPKTKQGYMTTDGKRERMGLEEKINRKKAAQKSSSKRQTKKPFTDIERKRSLSLKKKIAPSQ